jgi:hypothetical protein
MTRDQALIKIKKCLALAKSQNPHEAAAAMRQAQKLMAEHNLDEQEISLADIAESTVAARSQGNNLWECALVNAVAAAFACRIFGKYFWSSTDARGITKKRVWVFIGVGASAEVASYAYEVLSRQCTKARLEHVRKQPKTCKPITRTARGDQFALGWAFGVQEMLDKFANSERNQTLLERYMDKVHPALKTVEARDRSIGRNVRDDDIHLGVKSGRSAQLQRGVGSMPAQGLLA